MGLKVDVDEVRAAGSTIAQSVSKPGALSQAAVSAAAGDQVSTGVAAALTSRFHVLATHSAMGTQAATAAAALLHSNASTYQSQEDANTAYLGANGSSQPASAPSAGLNPIPFS